MRRYDGLSFFLDSVGTWEASAEPCLLWRTREFVCLFSRQAVNFLWRLFVKCGDGFTSSCVLVLVNVTGVSKWTSVSLDFCLVLDPGPEDDIPKEEPAGDTEEKLLESDNDWVDNLQFLNPLLLDRYLTAASEVEVESDTVLFLDPVFRFRREERTLIDDAVVLLSCEELEIVEALAALRKSNWTRAG